MPPPQLSSNGFVPTLELKIEPSYLAWVWWGGLHALLANAAVLVATPAPLRLALFVAVLAHAAVRRPRAMPSELVVSAEGSCLIPDWGADYLPLGRGTLICSLWVRLELGAGPRQRDLLLFADQLSAGDWARLRAKLRRTRRS
jgi:hypothetical protein